jgi:hypothetical protein
MAGRDPKVDSLRKKLISDHSNGQKVWDKDLENKLKQSILRWKHARNEWDAAEWRIEKNHLEISKNLQSIVPHYGVYWQDLVEFFGRKLITSNSEALASDQEGELILIFLFPQSSFFSWV